MEGLDLFVHKKGKTHFILGGSALSVQMQLHIVMESQGVRSVVLLLIYLGRKLIIANQTLTLEGDSVCERAKQNNLIDGIGVKG